MVTKYFNKEAKEITKNLFDDLNADPEYKQVYGFDNQKVRLIIEWTGEIKDASNLFRTSYPLFTAKQFDYLPDEDRWLESPESGTTFSNIKKAASFYEDFLLRWTGSYFDDDGLLIEVDNVLAPPPPPPAPDAPIGGYDEMVW